MVVIAFQNQCNKSIRILANIRKQPNDDTNGGTLFVVGSGMFVGQDSDQPIFSPLFCSFSQSTKGVKYSTKGRALIFLVPVITNMASCQGLDEPSSSIFL